MVGDLGLDIYTKTATRLSLEFLAWNKKKLGARKSLTYLAPKGQDSEESAVKGFSEVNTMELSKSLIWL